MLLKEKPPFDVGFSRFGSLKETVIQLVRCDKIIREPCEGVFLYLSIQPNTAQTQREHREGHPAIYRDWL
ncbi:MAG: hypothetical protein GXP08_03125 [Gammaproteobacteria bacterium]|nr:hypothetical protein [Gammaproteobacteria bacterium]